MLTLIRLSAAMTHSFLEGFFWFPAQKALKEEKNIRNDLQEGQIDHMVEDSFPASDPPSTY